MRTTLTSIAFGIFLLSSCHQAERSAGIPVQDTIPVKLVPLQQNGTISVVEATGVFTTDDETLLGFKNGGVISRIFVKEGDAVRKGQVLAAVHTSEVDAKAGQARLGVEKARRDYERAEKLYRDSVATLEQLQNARTVLAVAQEDLKSVGFNQQQSQIHSPVSGFVLAKLANEGQVVGPGTPVLQVNGASNGTWMLKVGVSDSQWAQIKVGDKATIQTDAIPNSTLAAAVAKKSEGLDPQSGTFTIHLALQGKPAGKLASGVFGKSQIAVSQSSASNGWRIPFSSLLDGNGAEGYVFISKDGKTARKQKVKVASMEKDEVLIESGLEDASALIVSGSPYLQDGSPIKVIK
ncbi:efflux RND transporter periplasmic adaptor subunit [Sphingobacterium hotanense]|uniref:efflux RND transporter periplasmic adaptor subunit n=1 Tax=Sphingobacterium hotanense TaxID=649196 RepID=UPI0011F1BFA9|nr:efflux RND transporter periplasmic adaptor subunit [Sphingobacterium hotanense]